VKDIHDVITQAKFGDDRLRGLGVVAGQTSAFPIDFAGRPYNTLALPCERVIRPVAKLVAFTVAVSGTVYMRYVTHPNRADTPSTVHVATTEVPFTRTCVSDVIELVEKWRRLHHTVPIRVYMA